RRADRSPEEPPRHPHFRAGGPRAARAELHEDRLVGARGPLMKSMRIRKGDAVLVIGGKDRGKQGRVIRTDPKKRRLYVEGLNMGIGEAKLESSVLEAATEQLGVIAGQQPNVRRARKSIASFKVREGMPVGVSVTLRRARMWEFLDRLTAVAVPRIRDFRGLN